MSAVGRRGAEFRVAAPNHVGHTAFHPDGQSLLTTCWDGTARLWPTPFAGRLPRTFPQMATHSDCIISPDGAFAAIASQRQVVIWQLPQQNMFVGQIAAWTDSFRRPRPSFDGRLVTLGARHESAGRLVPGGTTLSVARMSDGQTAGPQITLEGNLWDSCLCTDNRSVAAAYVSGSTGLLSVFDVATGMPAFEPLPLPSLPQSVAARPGHPQIAVLCQAGQLWVIDSRDGSLVLELSHEGWSGFSRYARVEYSPDGASLVSLTPQYRVFVRDANTGRLRYPSWSPVLEGGPLRTIAFSPDSRLLATGVNGKNAVQVWDLATGQSAAPPLPHPGDEWGIFSVAFSPDGRLVLSGHKDGLLRLWDWKLGELAAPPMQHPDEVYDGQFTPDGRYAVTAVRNSTVHVWDLTTGKLAAPPLRYPLAAENRHTLCISGWHVITSAPPNYLVVDLSVLLKEPEVDIESLRRRAELATNLKLQLGEMATLEQSEWDERWDAYVAARTSPQADAEALARALDESADSSARQLIARRAARLNLLDRLLVLRPEEPQLHLTLADRLASQGDDTGASRHRQNAMAALEKRLSLAPENVATASELASIILQSAQEKWAVLEPAEMKAEGGTVLSRQKDGSILASEEPLQNETYVITARVKPGRIAALRLEALPHDSLPGYGPGWGASNFHLTQFRASLQRSGQDPAAVQFRQAIASHSRSIAEGADPHDGPRSTIDGNQETVWDIWPRPGQRHWLVLSLTEPVDVVEGDQMIVHLDFRDRLWPRAKLGCFRLSVGHDASSVEKLRLIEAVRNAQILGFDALAAAYLATGNAARAAEFLRPTPETADSQVRLMLRALTQRALGDSAAAGQTAGRLVQSLKTAAPPPALRELCFDIANQLGGLDRRQFDRLLEQVPIERELARLTRNVEADPASRVSYNSRGVYFARLGRWRESADDYLQAVKLDPTIHRPWGIAASALLLAGDQDGYRQHCRAMLKQFHGTNDAGVADVICKNSLLLADAVELLELPTLVVREGAEDPKLAKDYYTWFIASNVLISYREGKPADAIDWTKKMPNLAGHAGALALVVRAMSEEKLGRHEQALKSLDEAEALIPVVLRTLGAADYTGPLPVPAASVYHDWLVAEILRREAAGLIRGK